MMLRFDRPCSAAAALTVSLFVLSVAASCTQAVGEVIDSVFPIITKRNIFDLKPNTTPPPLERTVAEPPAKIVLIGAKEHLGIKSAIFAVQQSANPGQPPAQRTHTIKEGETAGPITVVRIASVKTGKMEIVNNGTRMTIDFKSHANKLTAAANLATGFVSRSPEIPLPSITPTVGFAPQPEHASREVQAIMIEIERVRTQPFVDQGLLPPLPPTDAR